MNIDDEREHLFKKKCYEKGLFEAKMAVVLILTLGMVMGFAQGANCTFMVQGHAFDNGAVINSANVQVDIYTVPTGGATVYTETFTNACSYSRFSVYVSGGATTFDCDYGVDYFVDVSIGGTDVDWGSGGTERMLWRVNAGDIQSNDVEDGTLTADDLGTDSVDSDEIAASAVGTSEVDDNTLTANDLATNSVDADEIATDAVRADEIQASAVGTSEVADNTLTLTDIAAGALPFYVVDSGGDGDYTSIDSCVDAGGNRVCYVRPATYNECVSSSQNNQHVILAAGVTISCTTSNAFYISGADFKLSGEGRSSHITSSSDTGYGVRVNTGGDRAVIEGVRVSQTSELGSVDAILINDADDVVIRNVYIDQSDRYAVNIASTSDRAYVEKLEVACASVDEVCFRTYGDHTYVTDSYFHGNTATQTIYLDDSDYTVLTNSHVEDGGPNMVYAKDSNYIEISNNKIIDSAGVCVQLYTSASDGYYRVTDNYIDDCDSQHGVYLNGYQYGVFSGNIIRNAGIDGLYMGNADHASVTDNKILTPGDDCFELASGSNHAIIKGNTCDDPTDDGLVTGGTSLVTFESNTIRVPGDNGIYASACSGCIFSHNNIYSAADVGIQVTSGGGTMVSENYIYDPTKTGVSIVDSDEMMVFNNYIYSSGDGAFSYCIYTEDSHRAQIIGNNCREGSWTACISQTGDATTYDVIIADNACYTSTNDMTGVLVNNCNDIVVTGNTMNLPTTGSATCYSMTCSDGISNGNQSRLCTTEMTCTSFSVCTDNT